MGAAISVAKPVLKAMAVYMTLVMIRAAFASGSVGQNPTMVQLKQRVQEEQRKVEEARQRAKEATRWLEEMKQRAEEARRRAEEEETKREQARVSAERARRQAEEEATKAEQEKRHAEEGRRKAEEVAKRIEEERRRADEQARKAKDDQQQAERAKAASDKAAAEAKAALEKVENNLKEGIRPVIIPSQAEFNDMKRRLQYQEGIFHFAISGIAGSGKSSLLNAFRGLRNYDQHAAPTGITETTSTTTRYLDPDRANPFVWYDVPGAGTLKTPDWVYFNAQGLYIFDCIIVLFDNRFAETDIAILRNCARFKIPAYIVRSKSLQHIHNIKGDMKPSEGEDGRAVLARARDKYIKETRESVAHNLDLAQLPGQRVYIVDKEPLVQIVKREQPKEFIDEWELLQDLLSETLDRRPIIVYHKQPLNRGLVGG